MHWFGLYILTFIAYLLRLLVISAGTFEGNDLFRYIIPVTTIRIPQGLKFNFHLLYCLILPLSVRLSVLTKVSLLY